MNREEEQAIKDLADKVMSGKDEWVKVYVDGHLVATSTVFIKKYLAELDDWVREFISKLPKTYEFGKVIIHPDDTWQKKVGKETIYQFCNKDPDDEPTIIIETYDRLVEKGVIKVILTEGHTRVKHDNGRIG